MSKMLCIQLPSECLTYVLFSIFPFTHPFISTFNPFFIFPAPQFFPSLPAYLPYSPSPSLFLASYFLPPTPLPSVHPTIPPSFYDPPLLLTFPSFSFPLFATPVTHSEKYLFLSGM